MIETVTKPLRYYQKNWNITDKWDHVLGKIDAEKKVATFEHTIKTKGKF